MIADRGFHVTRLEDVGQVVGISGPGLYRYVSGKDDMLAQILVDISVRLVDGARAVMDRSRAEEWAADRTLRELLSFHVEFAVTEPDRIRVQEREIGNLAPQQREKVRSLQRMYISMWVDALRRSDPALTEDEARVQPPPPDQPRATSSAGRGPTPCAARPWTWPCAPSICPRKTTPTSATSPAPLSAAVPAARGKLRKTASPGRRKAIMSRP